MQSSKKLLIRLSSAGDVILTSPLLKLIKEREPDSEIHFVVKSDFSDLVQYNPNISTIHLVQSHADFGELEQLRQRLLKENFDLTLDLHNNFRSIYLRRGTSRRIQVISKEILKRTALVTMKLNLYSEIIPAALKYARVYDRTLTQVARPEIFFKAELLDKVDEIWKKSEVKEQNVVFLCPGARHFTKRWPAVNWKELARTLAADNQVVLIGGIEDKSICDPIEEIVGVINFSGRLALLDSTAMLSHADLVITNDSFLMHAANALGKKTITIFGSTVKEFGFFPYQVDNRIMEVDGLNCRPCSHIGRPSCPKSHFRCMLGTTPERVYRAAMELMD